MSEHDNIISNSALFNRRTSGRRPPKCPLEGKVLDYKDIETLKMFLSERGRILPARISGVCASNQRKLKVAVKRARVLALLPFAAT